MYSVMIKVCTEQIRNLLDSNVENKEKQIEYRLDLIDFYSKH